MSNFPILDLVVGMIFVYFLLGVITNAIIEIILTIFRARADILKQWLLKTFNRDIASFDDKGNLITKPLGEAIMNHFGVAGLTTNNQSPSYIDAPNFVAALIDKIVYDPQNPGNVAQNLPTIIAFLTATKALHPDLQRTFLNYAYEAQTTYQQLTEKTQSELEIFQRKLEDWYNTSTDRLSGDLKRKYTTWLTVVIGTILVISLNADSVVLAKYLYNNPETAAKVATTAYNTVNNDSIKAVVAEMRKTASADSNIVTKQQTINSADTLQARIKSQTEQIKNTQAALKGLDLPLGSLTDNYTSFKNDKGNAGGWLVGKFILTHLVGWLLTIFAISVGAPFWFDLLGQLANLRGTGTKPTPKTSDSGQ